MLLRLKVENFAILKHIEIDFSTGLTIISGESGSGKSMIIDAIQYLAGKRASSDIIRFGAQKAIIEGVFDLPENERINKLLEDFDIPKDELYIIRREVMSNRKSMIKMNSRMMTLQNLKVLMSEVINVHSQKESQTSLNTKKHREYLDQFINLDHLNTLKEYQETFYSFKTLNDKLKELEYKDSRRLEQLDAYQHQLNEINAANLQEDEEEEIASEIKLLENYENIHHALNQMSEYLNGDSAIQTQIYDIINHLNRLNTYDKSYDSFLTPLDDAYHTLTALEEQISHSKNNVAFDETHFNYLQNRYSEINHLKRKYNMTFDELIEHRDSLKNSIDELENITESFNDLKVKKEAQFKILEQKAKELHDFRIENKHFLETRVRKELLDLDMKDAEFEIRVEEGKFHTTGFSQVEFYISPNKGEPLKPLIKVASGGELSRIILAIRSIFSEMESHSLLILDEIDTGVSGSVANKMALKIEKLAQFMQVITISHLPQAASLADHHLLVEKRASGNLERTESYANYLDEESHAYEIARMISGENITSESIENAKALINQKQ